MKLTVYSYKKDEMSRGKIFLLEFFLQLTIM